MNLASRVLLGVAVCYSGWADWEMAGWKLLVGTAVLQHCSMRLKPSSTRSKVSKRNVTVHSGTADSSNAVLWLWPIVPFVIIPVCVDWDRMNRG